MSKQQQPQDGDEHIRLVKCITARTFPNIHDPLKPMDAVKQQVHVSPWWIKPPYPHPVMSLRCRGRLRSVRVGTGFKTHKGQKHHV